MEANGIRGIVAIDVWNGRLLSLPDPLRRAHRGETTAAWYVNLWGTVGSAGPTRRVAMRS